MIPPAKIGTRLFIDIVYSWAERLWEISKEIADCSGCRARDNYLVKILLFLFTWNTCYLRLIAMNFDGLIVDGQIYIYVSRLKVSDYKFRTLLFDSQLIIQLYITLFYHTYRVVTKILKILQGWIEDTKVTKICWCKHIQYDLLSELQPALFSNNLFRK